ncbi:MAG: hypothetical protein AB1483_10805 [Candidatus Zixiibacteriota bacterium]
MRIRKYMIGITLFALLAACSANAAIFDNSQKLSLKMEDVSLQMVLNMIAEQYSLNLVLSGEVQGNVSVQLQDVDIETALESILYPNGYNYYLRNDVIVVKPVGMDAVGELECEIVTLKYADAVAAKSALETIKSNKGNIVILDKTDDATTSTSGQLYAPNRIAITDYPSVISRMLNLVTSLDQPERLISIEVKIIETNMGTQTKLGIEWPSAVTSNFGASSSTSSTTNTASSSTDGKLGVLDPNNGNWTWGALSVNQVTAVLNMLEQSDNSKLISDPHITTLENHQAVIKSETIIPIPTVNRFTEGAATQDILTFYDEAVGISLKVTPRINEDGRITMDVEPRVEDIIGYTGSAEAQKPITISRSVQTRITVDDGQTAALGGLLKEDIIKSEKKVPLLGSIPLLGKLLFTSSSEETERTDLMILITPRIVVD